MKIPIWVSWTGLAEHVGIGFAVTLLCVASKQPMGQAVGMSFLIGLAHEMYDGDLLTADGAPWNGFVDILAFMLVPLIALAVT